MIIVRVEIPIMGQEFDFQLDEDTTAYEIQKDIADMVCSRNACVLSGNSERLMMWDVLRHTLIRPELTLRENGLESGSVIMLA